MGHMATGMKCPPELMHSIFKNISPDEGLEPSTLGLKVPRSTDWANRADTDTNQ